MDNAAGVAHDAFGCAPVLFVGRVQLECHGGRVLDVHMTFDETSDNGNGARETVIGAIIKTEVRK